MKKVPVKQISRQAFVDLLERRLQRGHLKCHFGLNTVPRLKKGNPFSNLRKIASYVGSLNNNYENGVNNQSKREGKAPTFRAQAPAWGRNVGKSLVKHKGNFKSDTYIRFSSDYSLSISYEDHFNPVDFETVPEEQVEPFLYKRKNEGEQNGNEVKYKLRRANIESVTYVQFDEIRYELY